MSDNTTTDPLLDHLRERQRELEDRITETRARLDEVEALLQAATDGRSRLSRRRRTNSTGTQPAFPEPGPALEAQP